jgi:O-antigen ligase
LFLIRWRPFGTLLIGLGWLSIAFLAFEMFSGKQIGFFSRYGSILGSPNDFGVFCGLFILGLLVCARKWSQWLLLALMVCGLFLTLSRSALAGALAGIASLLYLRRARIGAVVGIILFGWLAAFLVWKFPGVLDFDQVQFGLAHFDVDSSAIARLNELQLFQTRFANLDLATLLFGTDYFHIESWYLALLVRTGILGLLLWLAVMGATVVRGWRYRKLSEAHAVSLAGLISICVASVFIPYPDTFPTNLYLWLAVGTIWMPAFHESASYVIAK